MSDCPHSNDNCNIRPEFPQELKKEIFRYLVTIAGSVIVIAIAFYFRTSNSLSAHEAELNRINRQIETKADQAAIEKRLDRMENKLDNLIELQINKWIGAIGALIGKTTYMKKEQRRWERNNEINNTPGDGPTVG